MKDSEYKKHTSDWFSGKVGIVNVRLSNRGGDIICVGEEVIISGKSGRGGFNIRAEGKRHINRVNPSKIDLKP